MARLIKKGYLKVSHLHKIYYELRGNKGGIPLVHILGGPGSNIKEKTSTLYPSRYKVLLFDQRGCGKSKPKEELRENTTQLLVDDISKLMDFVGFTKAIISGGSWGSTLALCFAIRYPEKVKKLIVSGIFLGTKEEINYVYDEGIKNFAPDIYDKLVKKYGVKKNYSQFLTQKTLTGNSEASQWVYLAEMALMATSIPGGRRKAKKIFAHYIYNYCFLPKEYIINNTHRIKHIPTKIIHGRQDLICTPKHAFKLSQNLPKSKLYLVPGGHFMPDFKKELWKHL
jgi:proline iminopeptidase